MRVLCVVPTRRVTSHANVQNHCAEREQHGLTRQRSVTASAALKRQRGSLSDPRFEADIYLSNFQIILPNTGETCATTKSANKVTRMS